jgi:ubiquinone biosynthesis protein
VGFGLAVASWTESLAQVPITSLTLVGVGLLVLVLR